MKENISVEARKCFFAAVRYYRTWASSSLPPGAPCPGGLLWTEGSHNGREPPNWKSRPLYILAA